MIRFRNPVLLAAALATFQWAWAVSQTEAATLIASDTTSGELVQLDPQTGAKKVIGPFNNNGDNVIADLAWDSKRGILYGSSTLTNFLYKINPVTGAATRVGSLLLPTLAHGLEYDTVHDVLYASSSGGPFSSPNLSALYRINPVSAQSTRVGQYTTANWSLSDLAFDPVHDVMYATSSFEDPARGLYTINVQTAALTHVGSFSPPQTSLGSALAFDSVLGMFASNTHSTPEADDDLYRVNPLTGAATLIGPTGTGNALGMTFIPEPATALAVGFMVVRVSSRLRR